MSKKKYRSVLHKDCGGEIVLIAADSKNTKLSCKRCKACFLGELQPPGLQKMYKGMGLGEDMEVWNGE